MGYLLSCESACSSAGLRLASGRFGPANRKRTEKGAAPPHFVGLPKLPAVIGVGLARPPEGSAGGVRVGVKDQTRLTRQTTRSLLRLEHATETALGLGFLVAFHAVVQHWKPLAVVTLGVVGQSDADGVVVGVGVGVV